MANVLTALKGVNTYPVSLQTLRSFALLRGLDLDAEATKEQLESEAFNLCKADVLMWVSVAPDSVSESGRSVSLSEDLRKRLQAQAKAIYDKYETAEQVQPTYGYKGSRL